MNERNKNFVGSAQIRAARALLNWSQEDLATAANLSIATIRKLELGHISPRGKTTDYIHRAFEDAGLEFIEPGGVRHRPEDIVVYQGPEGVKAFCDDIYKVAYEKGGEIVQVWNSDQSIFEMYTENRTLHFSRMQTISNRVAVKCILTQSFEFTAAPYCQYRSMSKHYVNSVPFYVYGDKYAIILFQDDPPPRIIVVHSRVASEAFRQQFASMWEKATPLIQQAKEENRKKNAG